MITEAHSEVRTCFRIEWPMCLSGPFWMGFKGILWAAPNGLCRRKRWARVCSLFGHGLAVRERFASRQAKAGKTFTACSRRCHALERASKRSWDTAL